MFQRTTPGREWPPRGRFSRWNQGVTFLAAHVARRYRRSSLVALAVTVGLCNARATYAGDPMTTASHRTAQGFCNPGYPWREPPLSVTLPFFFRRAVTSTIPGLRSGAPDRVANDG